MRILYPLINRKSKLSQQNKLLLYKSVYRPILTYASPVWDSAAKCHQNKLQVIQNKCLKIILDLPFYFSTRRLHNMVKIPTIPIFLDKIKRSFQNKLHAIDNVLINSLNQTLQ